MDNTEEKNAQSCTPDEACCCDTVASTKEEISAALDNLVDLIKRYDGRAIFSAVLATGNNGSLTLKLNVKRKGGVNQVVIEPKVTASIPDPTIAPRIMFADTSGALHTDDPAQGKLDLDAPVKVTFPAAADVDAGVPAKVAKRA